jgi:hypothetical protein
MTGQQLYADNVSANLFILSQVQGFTFSTPISQYQIFNLFVPTSKAPSQNTVEFINVNDSGYRFKQLTSSTSQRGNFILEQFNIGSIPGNAVITVQESTGNFIFSLQGGGAIQINNGTSVTPLQFFNASGTNCVGFQAGNPTSNTVWTLPITDSTGVQALISNGSGILSWADLSGGGTVTLVSGTAGQIDVANGTTTPVISIDSGYVGQASITTLGTIMTGTWNGSLIPLAYGGTNADLTASNGGIFYSTASAAAILAGTSTANQILLSGSSASPAWSTAIYPVSTTVNQLLYSSSTNTIVGLTTANNSILVTNGSGVPSLSTTLPFTLPVNTGGTGVGSFTAYSVLCGGTTSTGALQNVSGVGTTNQALISSGASALPTWQAIVNSITGTANQVIASGSTGAITLSLPQNIHTGATPTFAGLTLSGRGLWSKGADLASASTVTFGADGNFFHITGTTTITAFASLQAGTTVNVEFTGILTLTHNATSLILPNNGANITTAAGDTAMFVSEGSGNWRCLDYQSASGAPLSGGTYAPANAKYIIQTTNASLTNAQILASLSTGLVKNTTTTGVLSIGVPGTDYYAPGFPTTIIDTIGGTTNFSIGSNGIPGAATGDHNCALGIGVLESLTSGSQNTGGGIACLTSLTTGTANTFYGEVAGLSLTTGSGTSGFGRGAGLSQSVYTNCCFFGDGADASVNSLTNAIVIGFGSSVATSNTIVLGNTSIVSMLVPGLNLGFSANTIITTNTNGNLTITPNGTGILSLSSNVGIGTTTPHSALQFGNNIVNRVLTLFEQANDQNQFYGFGINSGVLRYQVFAGASHVFYVSTSSTTSAEVMRVDGSANFYIGSAGSLRFRNSGATQYVGFQSGTLSANTVWTLPTTDSTGTQALMSNGSASMSWASVYGPGNPTTIRDTSGASTYNISVGTLALNASVSGSDNTAMGYQALTSLTSGGSNTAFGTLALQNITTNSNNAAFGSGALTTVNPGSNNVAVGNVALNQMTAGNDNTAVGATSGFLNGLYSNCCFFGYGADASVNNLTNAIAIGYNSSVAISNALVLGNGCDVGIGTSSPHSPLQFASSINNRIITLFETTNNLYQYYGFGIQAGILVYEVPATTNFHVFYAGTSSSGSNELMRIGGNGEVGIGTPSPDATLSVSGTADKTGGGLWATFSDSRIKKVMGEYKHGLNEIMQIVPKIYNYTEASQYKEKDLAVSRVGIIAQEIEEILPECITLKESRGFSDLRMYDASPLTYTLINAIKELNYKIEHLQQDSMRG